MLTPDVELRQVLNAAQWEAGLQGTDQVESTHLLLGLFHPPLSAAGRALLALGMSPKRERLPDASAAEEETWPPPVPVPPQNVRLSREAERILQLAEQEARARGEKRLTPSHLVIGLLEARRGDGYLLLRMHGITLPKARQALSV